jgi:hypothetical protein
MLRVQDVMAFLDGLKAHQVPWVPYPAILGFLATTRAQNAHPSVAIARLEGLSPGAAPSEVVIRLRGHLPRTLLPGENITVSISRYERYSGYQIKTRDLRDLDAAGENYERAGDRILVHGRRTYTTHHSPYELQFYDRVPFDELLATVGTVDHGVVALGVDANVSPRLLFHHEERYGFLSTYHGDGVAMKTFRNLSENPCATLLAFDLDSLQGYALVGRCEEVPRDENPRATEQIDKGFQALGFGRPSRIFRHKCDRIERIDVENCLPQGTACP